MKHKIKYSFEGMRPIELLGLARNVIAKMTGDPNFPIPYVDQADLTSKADELDVAIDMATDGSKIDLAHRNTVVNETIVMMHSQANYLQLINQTLYKV